ncbi:MAG: DUF1353 domain-containing protein [Smithella sp.]
MSEFLSELEIRLVGGDSVWELDFSLKYKSDLLNCEIVVPAGFQTDLASVPRWIPIASNALLGRAHREAVIHDYVYRKDSNPIVSESIANKVFLEAMELRGKSWYVRFPMYWGVCIGGWTSYHKMYVNDRLAK